MAARMDQLTIYFVTWNVATKYPEQELHDLLDLSRDKNKQFPDLYFIGLQEVKSQPQNMVIDYFSDDPWTKAFKSALKEYDYVKFRTQRLQGLVLNAFCLRKHIAHLRLIEAQYTRTGFGGMWGNKGAVSIRLNIYGVSVCIVNTHLTPHDHLLADRIADYNTIVKDHSFSAPDTSHIFFHDYVFWIGDLNFRLDGEDLTADGIDLLVQKNQLGPLLSKDQLKRVMKNGDAFYELNENDITFPPTYKYEFMSQEFDLKRRPSWTDRILYKVNTDVYGEEIKLNATQRTYRSHSSYVQSDHKPVTGEFDITIRHVVKDHGVEFQPISEWFIDEENSVSYKFLGDAKPACGDWIGLFDNEFSSLDEWIVYEHVERGKSTPTSMNTNSLEEEMRFSDNALRAPGIYRLVYVAQREGLMGILGVSPPFSGHRRPI